MRTTTLLAIVGVLTLASVCPAADDTSVTPMRDVIDRYAEDRGALHRAHDLRLSPSRHERLKRFSDEQLGALDKVEFDRLDQAGRIDYLLLRNELRFQLKQMKHRRQEMDEAAALLPFAQTVVQLEEARRRVDDVDPEHSARALTDISRQVDDVRKGLEEKLKSERGKKDLPSPVLATRAARLVDDVRASLKDWHGFYSGYDPEFTWWARQPYPKADKDLEEYAGFLRKKLAGQGETPDDAPVIGDPIGRAALLDALEAEMIPYTPEELIEIANEEFAWCEAEMKRAADDLGFAGDWKKALDHVSRQHVKPGAQPKLIKELAEEATQFVEERGLVTVPTLCKETWRMEMMSVERQKVNPYFTGGEVISVSFPTDTMTHEDKLMSLRGNNPSFCRATVHHELIPGHHLQIFMAERYNTHRRIFRSPFLVEGWALYWEMRLWDLGFPRTADDRVGMLFWRSHRCARIIFSLKFHLGQMTAREAIDLLVDRVGHERRNATAEVRRSVAGGYEPLYQAAYMLGGLQIRALHKELVESGKMTDRTFHDAILRENAIPVAMVRASLTNQPISRDFKADWRFYGDPEVKPHADPGPPSQPQAEAGAAPRVPRVYRDKVDPHWLEGNTRFWYRNDLPGGKQEYVLVDAEKGTRTPGFDPGTIAGAADDGRLPAGRTPRPSRSTGGETEITFSNESAAEVRLYWSDTGGARQPYGTVQPGAKRPQHTYAGHVWVATEADGKVLAVFEADDRPAVAVIDGKGGDDVQRPRRRRRENDDADLTVRQRRADPTRSPDGKWEAFVRDHDLWLRQPDSKDEHRLTTDGSAAETYARQGNEAGSRPEVYWSPDSRRVVAIRTRTAPERLVHLVESSPPDQVQPKLHAFPYAKPGDEISQRKPRLFDAENRRPIPVSDELFPNPWDISRLRWDNDSARFTFLYNQRGHQVLRVVAVDAATGAARAIVDEKSDTFIDYSGKLFLETLDGPGELVWMSERDGWNHLYLYDAKTGAVKNQVTRGEWLVRGVERVDPEKRQVWFRAGGVKPGEDPYHVHLCRVNFDGTGMTVLTGGDGTHAVRFSPDRNFFLDTWSRVDRPPVTELRRSADGSLVCTLEEADASEASSAGALFPERFVAKGRDGVTDIYGIIHRPKDFDPARKYPVIENIYAGPQDAHVPKSFRARWPQQRLADRGFIVVQIDGMGTSQRSKKFQDVCWKNLADAGFPDRILWMKAAAEKEPAMDLSRVGIYGGSAGGQNALGALLHHGDFYRAAVADCGCHDNRMDKIWWNEQWMGWPVGPEYAASSNVTHAHKLPGNLLLIVGELDRNVDPASTMQVANALVKADKDFDLLVIPGTGHGAGDSPYGRRRTTDFFVRHLLDEEPAGANVGAASSRAAR
jgi:dipeptidyl-peptidase-4